MECCHTFKAGIGFSIFIVQGTEFAHGFDVERIKLHQFLQGVDQALSVIFLFMGNHQHA